MKRNEAANKAMDSLNEAIGIIYLYLKNKEEEWSEEDFALNKCSIEISDITDVLFELTDKE